jgi:hypothetical protein
MIAAAIAVITLAFVVRMDEYQHLIKQNKDANSNSNR